MTRLFLALGRRLMISNRHRSVRQSLILFFTNFLLFAGVVFTIEIILILLGVVNVPLPLTHRSVDIISRILF
jgi:hypothetical protein